MIVFKRTTAGFAAAASAALCLATFASGFAATSSRIVNGLDSQDFPTTGALLNGSPAGTAITVANASSWCSGTLVGCQTFLTAAHCVADDMATSHYWVYLQHGGIAQVSSITVHPGYVSNESGNDLAVVKLTAPVTGIDPTPLNTTHDLDAIGVGLDATIAGFGRSGGGSYDYGIKQYGAVVTADCDLGATGGEGNDVLVCWDYDAVVGPAGEDSNTCNGDSGGPLFMDFSGTIELAGVTSAGSSETCLSGDHSWDASVYANRVWITAQLGADSTASCGTIDAVGDPAVTVYENSGSLSSGSPSASFNVNLGSTPTLVRFTLNGTDDGFNPDFFVKQGAGASASVFDCKSDGASVFGACEIETPAAGSWSVFVRRTSGAGQYQLTTTVFSEEPSVCGNDIAESGEACDGADPGSCPIGPCVACECPAPVCGNDVLEDGEQCDGTSDAACAGACLGDCTCPSTCSGDDLYGLVIISDATRFTYKALLYDLESAYAALDPRDDEFSLSIDDGSGGLLAISIPAADPRWIKADPVRRKYGWKGDGSLDGLRRVKLVCKDVFPYPYWLVLVRGREVTGAGSLDLNVALDFSLGVGGTCNLETW